MRGVVTEKEILECQNELLDVLHKGLNSKEDLRIGTVDTVRHNESWMSSSAF